MHASVAKRTNKLMLSAGTKFAVRVLLDLHRFLV